MTIFFTCKLPDQMISLEHLGVLTFGLKDQNMFIEKCLNNLSQLKGHKHALLTQVKCSKSSDG